MRTSLLTIVGVVGAVYSLATFLSYADLKINETSMYTSERPENCDLKIPQDLSTRLLESPEVLACKLYKTFKK